MLIDHITGSSKLLALIGNPVKHSISPQLHNTLSEMLGINAVYIPIKVEKDRLCNMLNGFKASNFTGFNATIPFKEEILNYVDEVSNEVKLMGCANTVKNIDGRLYAYNTDAEGFARAFVEEAGVSFKDKNVLIIGAGGTCRALAVKIASLGAGNICITNRTLQRAEVIAGIVNTNVAEIAETFEINNILKLQQKISECDILINTTSVGMSPNTEGNPISENITFDSKTIVYDVIFNPTCTKLLRQANSFGCKTINGLGMLFYQGILAYEIWMEIKVPQSIIEHLYTEFTKYLSK